MRTCNPENLATAPSGSGAAECVHAGSNPGFSRRTWAGSARVPHPGLGSARALCLTFRPTGCLLCAPSRRAPQMGSAVERMGG